MAEYREGRLTLDQLTAFAVCDDHESQERVWFEEGQRNPQSIRRALTRSLVTAAIAALASSALRLTKKPAEPITRDLFDEEAAYFADSLLLDRLVLEKLRAESEAIRREGWSFVEVQLN